MKQNAISKPIGIECSLSLENVLIGDKVMNVLFIGPKQPGGYRSEVHYTAESISYTAESISSSTAGQLIHIFVKGLGTELDPFNHGQIWKQLVS